MTHVELQGTRNVITGTCTYVHIHVSTGKEIPELQLQLEGTERLPVEVQLYSSTGIKIQMV